MYFITGKSYKLTMNDGNVAAGEGLIVSATTLSAANSLTFNGSHETDGHFNIFGGAGDDVLIGGDAGNAMTGGLGQDRITTGNGVDILTYSTAADSTGVTRDIITGFDAQHDSFNLTGAVTGIDGAVMGGLLNAGNFDGGLAAALDAAHLGALHAVLFTPDSGSLAGHVFLVVDANGVAGYQAGADLVFQLEDATNLGSLDTGDFT